MGAGETALSWNSRDFFTFFFFFHSSTLHIDCMALNKHTLISLEMSSRAVGDWVICARCNRKSLGKFFLCSRFLLEVGFRSHHTTSAHTSNCWLVTRKIIFSGVHCSRAERSFYRERDSTRPFTSKHQTEMKSAQATRKESFISRLFAVLAFDRLGLREIERIHLFYFFFSLSLLTTH